MKRQHSMNVLEGAQDDIALMFETARRALAWVAAGILAATFASVGVLVYVYVSGSASAEPDHVAARTRVEVFGGQCQSKEIGNYVWHNYHYPYELDLNGGCGMVAVSRIFKKRGAYSLGWRLAYVDLGRIGSDAQFPMRDEEQVSIWPDGTNCNATTWFGCVGHGRGKQSARGISLGIVAERDVAKLTFGGELGLYVYEGRFTMAVDPVAPSSFSPQRWDWRGYQITPFAGAGVRYGYASLMVRAYGRVRAAEHGCGVCSGLANGTVVQYLVGASIPF